MGKGNVNLEQEKIKIGAFDDGANRGGGVARNSPIGYDPC
jgi:hypothetical protein